MSEASEIQKVDSSASGLAILTDPEALELIEQNLNGLRVQFERVKIPSSGGKFFELVGESGEPVPAKEIVGVILDHYAVNAYWSEEFGSGGGNPPQCSALDGKTGIGDPGGNCLTCRLNQWGTEPKNGRGKACKNLHRLYVLPKDDILPLLIAAPPTSLANLGAYMQFLTKKRKKLFSAVLTTIRLEQAANKDGTEYSRIVLSSAGDLDPKDAMALRKYIAEIKPLLRAVEVQAGDYSVPDETEADAQTQKAQPEPF